MSVWKGNNLIAMSVPGQNGTNGQDGRNGQGVMIVPSFTELHNNINANGDIEITNKVVPDDGESQGYASWCEVGGYRNQIVGTGQATMVWGYGNTVGHGQSGTVFGCRNNVKSYGQGISVEGFENTAKGVSSGVHIEGYNNLIQAPLEGVHV